ncbi:hypothetical protein JTE90_018217 [Oedothorax gibbosus]|uniref:MULE transposase domain-containing protein n=1 Tax=Oedothorax gibbosus TaxID=931172 RepID=A0AAV6U8T4_9ARAC|nr:hypothetical protein JTE90_018217 [Oedothorax gibbosus]
MRKSKNNPILLYKTQGEEIPEIKKDDFLLGIMNSFQKKMLLDLGNDRVCLDSTHGITNSGFELVTVLVVDKYNEGVPVAFLITSTVNTINLSKFFTAIKTALEVNLTPKAFMSDDACMFYNAWQAVFGPCVNLLCSWHVDRAWQGHLNGIEENKKKALYHTLKTLMYELEEGKFQGMLSEFLMQLHEDSDTLTFAQYFEANYSGRTKLWANPVSYCGPLSQASTSTVEIELATVEIPQSSFIVEENKLKIKCIAAKLENITTMDEEKSRQIKAHLYAIEHLLSVPDSKNQPPIPKDQKLEPANKKAEK